MMKEYEVKALVGALAESPESNLGDFEGEVEFDEKNDIFVFDGEYNQRILASSQEEAVELLEDALMHCDCGDLTNVGFDKESITIEKVHDKFAEFAFIDSPETGEANASVIITNDIHEFGQYEFLSNGGYSSYQGDREPDSPIMQEVEKLEASVYTDSHCSECFIAMLDGDIYVGLENQYDEETAKNNDFTADSLYRAMIDKAMELAEEVKQAHDEMNVFIKANEYSLDELKKKVETIAQVLDNEAYNLRSPLEIAKTASDLDTISAKGWEAADANDLKAIQQHFNLVPLYDYMKENCDNAVGDISDELLEDDANAFFDLEDKEYDMGDTEEENYNYIEECDKEIADTSHEIAAELNEYNPLVAIDHDGNAAATLLFEKDGEIYLPKEIYLPSLPENGSRMDVDVEVWNPNEDKIEIRTESFRVTDSQIPFDAILKQVSHDLDLIEPKQNTKNTKQMEMLYD